MNSIHFAHCHFCNIFTTKALSKTMTSIVLLSKESVRKDATSLVTKQFVNIWYNFIQTDPIDKRFKGKISHFIPDY